MFFSTDGRELSTFHSFRHYYRNHSFFIAKTALGGEALEYYTTTQTSTQTSTETSTQTTSQTTTETSSQTTSQTTTETSSQTTSQTSSQTKVKHPHRLQVRHQHKPQVQLLQFFLILQNLKMLWVVLLR